jgi:deoxyribonuclease IV
MKGSTQKEKSSRRTKSRRADARVRLTNARTDEEARGLKEEEARGVEKSPRPRLGFHAGIAGGLQNALLKAQALGADAVQIFSRNPRGWKARPLEEEEVETFRRVRAETGVSPVVIHANYLINLAAADASIREKSVASFREEVERGLQLGADYLVVHPGSARGACEADALRTCAESLSAACDGLRLGDFRILLENTAGQGECIGHRFEHLRDIASLCPGLDLGVCLDTAHAFTAGYDLRDEDGLGAALDSLEANVGLANVRAVHFNDSKADYNSRVDRHWHLGLGHIGAQALRRVARDPRLSHAAFLLETPQNELGDDARNLALLRSFLDADAGAEEAPNTQTVAAPNTEEVIAPNTKETS